MSAQYPRLSGEPGAQRPATPGALTEAPVATAADGFVLLDHSAGIAITLTAAAAAVTGERLMAAAAEAADQRDNG